MLPVAFRSPSRRGVNWNLIALIPAAFIHWSPSRRGVNWNIRSRVPVKTQTEAPLAGAWIKIENALKERLAGREAPLAGAWIEIDYTYYLFEYAGWSPSRRGVNWNIHSPEVFPILPCSPSRRGVNWNWQWTDWPERRHEAPLAGAWIEILYLLDEDAE